MGKTLKKRLAMMMAVAMLTTTVPQTTFASDYTNHWANIPITKWVGKGLIRGYEDGTFRPKNIVTRAEMAAILCRLFGFEQTEKAKAYSDVAADKWYATAVALVSDAGIMYEVEGTTTFRPNAGITREEAAYALATAYKVTGEADVTFKDAEAIADWAEAAVEAMFAKGYVNGDNKGCFNPKSTLTRAELVTMIDNMTVDVINVAGTYSNNVAGNLIVNTRDVELKDMIIEGNLYLAEGIGDGDITLDNIQVKGQVIVEGGGINSIKSKNSKYYEKFIVSAENPVRVVVEGDAVRVEAMPGTTVTLTGSFSDVIVAPNVEITVKDATVETVIVAPATNPNDKIEVPVIKVEGTAKVDKIQADAPVEVKGEGTVGNLVVNTEDVKIEQTPGKVEIGEGQDKDLTVNIGGKDQTQDSLDKDKPDTNKPSGSGSSNGGGSSNNSGNSNNGHTCDTNKKVNISGRVHYKGEALEHAEVEIFERHTNKWITSTRSDKEGHYSFYVPACSDYGIRVIFQDEEGYGYYAENTNIPTTHNNTTVNIEVEKKHVMSFKVVDKNNVPIRDIRVVTTVKGKSAGMSYTDNFGETISYLWDENAPYGFEFYIGDKLIHTIPESIQVGKDYKQEMTVSLEAVGLNDTIVGEVIKRDTGERLANVVVDLYEATPRDAYGISTEHVATTVTDAKGVYRFKTPDLNKNYRVEVRTKTEEGKYYASVLLDARFAAHTELLVKQAYGINIKVVDKNNKPMPNVSVTIGDPNGYTASRWTQEDGSLELFDYYTIPGLYVVKAQIDDDVLVQSVQVEKDTYTYEVVLKFDNKVGNSRVATITVNASSVEVGDRVIPVESIFISAPMEEGNSQHGKWGFGDKVRDGKVTFMIPEEYQNKAVTIEVAGPADEILYTERNVSFTGDVLNHAVDLENLPTYQLTGQILVDGEVTTSAALTINMNGWNYYAPTEVGTPIVHNGSYVQSNLIQGEYLVRAEATTRGALYVSTSCVGIKEDTRLNMDLKKARKIKVKVEDELGKALANVAVRVGFLNSNDRYVDYTTLANDQGEFEILEGLEEGQQISFWVSGIGGVNYETLEGEFYIGNGDSTFTVKARLIQ